MFCYRFIAYCLQYIIKYYQQKYTNCQNFTNDKMLKRKIDENDINHDENNDNLFFICIQDKKKLK